MSIYLLTILKLLYNLNQTLFCIVSKKACAYEFKHLAIPQNVHLNDGLQKDTCIMYSST